MAAAVKLPYTVGDGKKALMDAYGKPVLPMGTTAFCNEILSSTIATMTSPSYAYSPVFGLGLTVLSDRFMFEVRDPEERERVKASLCVALQLDPKEVKADAD